MHIGAQVILEIKKGRKEFRVQILDLLIEQFEADLGENDGRSELRGR